MAREIKITRELLDAYVQELDIPVKLQMLLESNGIETVMDLLYCCGKAVPCDKCEKDRSTCGAQLRLMDIRQFGPASLESIFKGLRKFTSEDNSEQSPRP